MNVLFITKDMKNYIDKSSYYLAQELGRQSNLTLWHGDGYLKDIVNQVSPKPDFILLNDFKQDYCPFIRNLPESPVPYGAIVHDLKYKMKQRKQWFLKEKVNFIFSIYKRPFAELYPEFQSRMIWLPHHVPESIYQDAHQNRPINWLMAGAMYPHIYPERVKFYQLMKRETNFLFLEHPGYRNLSTHETGYFTGEKYVEKLNQSKMLITCDSNDHFALLKYYEAAACGTMILASMNDELIELGFEDGKTMVKVTPETLLEKAYYYLNHEDERLKITTNAKRLIRERHSTQQRVSELLKYMSSVTMRS